jgi:hypothetical protein
MHPRGAAVLEAEDTVAPTDRAAAAAATSRPRIEVSDVGFQREVVGRSPFWRERRRGTMAVILLEKTRWKTDIRHTFIDIWWFDLANTSEWKIGLAI